MPTVSYSFAGQTVTRPVPWDAVYLQRWTSFIAALGAAFDGEPTLALVHATHASHNSFEMQLGLSAQPQYSAAGYTDATYAQSWETVLDAFGAAFPSHALDVDIHPVFGSDAVAQQVVAHGTATLGDRFGAFGGWWSVNNAVNAYPGMWSLFHQTAPASFTNVQNVGSFVNTPERYDHDLAVYEAAFELAFDTGIRYFEVWNADLLEPSLDPLLTDVHARVHCTGWTQLYDGGSTVFSPALDVGGCPAPGETISFDVTSGPALADGALVFGTSRQTTSILGGDLLVGPVNQLLAAPISLDASGAYSVPLALPASVPPLDVTLQAIAYDATSGSWWLSNAAQMKIE